VGKAIPPLEPSGPTRGKTVTVVPRIE